MPSTTTVRQWQKHTTWPTILAILWFVLYTSAVLLSTVLVDTEKTALAYLFSPQHLSQPRGWLFALSLLFVLLGLLIRTYMILSRR